MLLVKLCETREYPPQLLEHWLHTLQNKRSTFELILRTREGKVELLCTEDLSLYFPGSTSEPVEDVDLKACFWVRQSKGPLLPIRRIGQFENQLERERLTPLNQLFPPLAKREDAFLRFQFRAVRERRRVHWVKKVKSPYFEPERRFDQWESKAWMSLSGWRVLGPLVRRFLFAPKIAKTAAQEQTETRHERENAKQAVLDKLSRPLFEVEIGSSHPFQNFFHGFNVPYLGSLKLRGKPARMLLSSEEIASILAPPNMKEAAPFLLSEPTAALPCSLPKPLDFPEEDRKRHVYVVGKTGMGKSTLLLNLLQADALAGRSVVLMDPHGDLVEDALNVIPPARHSDLILLNPADSEHALALNPLETQPEDNPTLTASALLEMFKALSQGSWGPRLEYILRNALLALAQSPNATLLDLPRLLTDPPFLENKLTTLPNPEVRRFFQDEFLKQDERTRQEWIAPILNKVGPLLTLPQVRNIVGQPKSKFHFEPLFQKNKIVLVNLSKGRLGEDGSRLLGMIFISLVQNTLLRRAKESKENRSTVSLVLDEFQNFCTPTLLSMLSESRKYGLALTLAHQYLTQVPPEIQDAVLGNAGSLFCFRTSYADAQILAPTLNLTENDLSNLAPFHAYVQRLHQQKRVPVFRFQVPLPTPQSLPNLLTLQNKSRERYCRPSNQVEAKLRERYNRGKRMLRSSQAL